MTKEAYLKLCEAQWEKVAGLASSENLQEHEKALDGILVNFGRALLEQSLGELPKDHRQKKSAEPIWADRIESQV